MSAKVFAGALWSYAWSCAKTSARDWYRSTSRVASRVMDNKVVQYTAGAIVLAVCAYFAKVYWKQLEGIARWLWENDKDGLVKYLIAIAKGVPLVVGTIVVVFASLFVVVPFVVLPVPMSLWGGVSGAVRGIRIMRRAARAPRLARVPGDERPAAAELVMCQLSDLHLKKPGEIPYEFEVEDPEHAPDGSTLRHVAARVLEAAETEAPAAVAVTGDITDLGREDEWAVARDVLGAAQSPVVAIVPGNHDVAINKHDTADPELKKRSKRAARFRAAAKAMERGDWVTNGDAFPRCAEVSLASGRRVAFVSLDSNRYPSHHTLSNAVGELGKRQVGRLRSLLAEKSGPVVVLLHHHPGRPADEKFKFKDERKEEFTVALDGGVLLDLCCEYNARDTTANPIIVVHGHRHVEVRGTYESGGGSVQVFGLPSSTLGQASGHALDGVPRYGKVYLADGQWFTSTVRVDGR